jgi:hypothetical protein
MTVTVTAGYGWLELSLRRAYDQGRSGIARDTPSDNTPTHPQHPIQRTSRNLEPDQIRILDRELPNLKPYASVIHMASTLNDNESWDVTRQYSNELVRSGVRPDEFQLTPRGTDDRGLLILVPSINKIPQPASRLQQALTIADIYATAVQGDEGFFKDHPDINFVFFVAPAPFN